ncbi:hypothetical protein LB577_21800, partial [Mesorhizobium sp. B283B1A]|uniref:hypothetical protein n=1 Tax=Mesorhizobium sp. B283B1A TaxID=2876665 RepID=UPI001CD0B3A8
ALETRTMSGHAKPPKVVSNFRGSVHTPGLFFSASKSRNSKGPAEIIQAKGNIPPVASVNVPSRNAFIMEPNE